MTPGVSSGSGHSSVGDVLTVGLEGTATRLEVDIVVSRRIELRIAGENAMKYYKEFRI